LKKYAFAHDLVDARRRFLALSEQRLQYPQMSLIRGGERRSTSQKT